MQFDRTLIVTRERDYLDILDLALCVVRRFAGPLSLSLAAGVAPFVVLNAWLLAGYSDQDFELGYPPIYLLLMTLLVLYEIPLATRRPPFFSARPFSPSDPARAKLPEHSGGACRKCSSSRVSCGGGFGRGPISAK